MPERGSDSEKVFHRTSTINLVLWLALGGQGAADVSKGAGWWPFGLAEVSFLVIVIGCLMAVIAQHRAYYRYRAWKQRSRRANDTGDTRVTNSFTDGSNETTGQVHY